MQKIVPLHFSTGFLKGIFLTIENNDVLQILSPLRTFTYKCKNPFLQFLWSDFFRFISSHFFCVLPPHATALSWCAIAMLDALQTLRVKNYGMLLSLN